MRRREFIIALPLLISAELFAQDKGKFTGIWELDVGSKGISGHSKIVVMKQTGDSVKVRDLQTGKDYSGKVTDQGIKFPLTLEASSSKNPTQASFDGVMKQGMMKGHTEIEGSKYEWTANRLTSVWSCSNHTPKHTAKSTEDMNKLTRESKCEGWHRARPDELGS